MLPLRIEDVGRAAGIIARAFHEDALNVHLYPDGATRARLSPVMFDAIVRYDQLFGQVDHLPGFTAVATWMRPGETEETPAQLAQAGFDDLPVEVPLDTLDAVFSYIGPAIANLAPEPHWHLRLLGVDSGHQGGGLEAILYDTASTAPRPRSPRRPSELARSSLCS